MTGAVSGNVDNLGYLPFRVIDTTRFIISLVVDSELNLHLPLLLGKGTNQDLKKLFTLSAMWKLFKDSIMPD